MQFSLGEMSDDCIHRSWKSEDTRSIYMKTEVNALSNPLNTHSRSTNGWKILSIIAILPGPDISISLFIKFQVIASGICIKSVYSQ